MCVTVSICRPDVMGLWIINTSMGKNGLHTF